MKYKPKSARVPGAAVFASVFFTVGADAAIIIGNFQLTRSTVSFDISGQMDGPAPPNPPILNAARLYFVNAVTTDPGFVTPIDFEAPVLHTWTGSQELLSSFPLFTGDSNFGDYFGMGFLSNLSVGEAVNGSVTATFSPGTFDPSAVSTINVVWGADDAGQFSEGTIQTTIVVPEPSSVLLLGLGLLGSLGLRSRTR